MLQWAISSEIAGKRGSVAVDADFVYLSARDIPQVHAQIVDVYRSALGQPPYNMQEIDVRRFAETLLRHATYEGFQGYAARNRTNSRIIGFTYGYTSRRGLWWRNIVEQALGPAQAAQWLEQAFEFVELAVHPDAQGQGFGGHLHDTLLSNLPYRTAVLSTAQSETVALTMYQRRGWVTLKEHFFFPGALIPYRIMGLIL
jgi:ribosomal protein S18 acetylase RimI-like enzyme